MRPALPLILCLLAVACADETPPQRAAPAAPPAPTPRPEPVPDPRSVVERLGERLDEVSLLAPAEQLRATIRRQYGDLVTGDLLDRWTQNPREAPGRATSSPSPERIDIIRVVGIDTDRRSVYGEIVETAATAPVRRIPVAIGVTRAPDGWRIGSWAPAAPLLPGAEVPAEGAVAVIQSYYGAIARREYERAWRLWEGGGAASGATLEEFRAGFASTERVEVNTGEPGRVEGAAGSRFVEIPVEITAVTTGGKPQRFRGKYVLRRSVVDGATDDQQAWRIASATIAPAA